MGENMHLNSLEDPASYPTTLYAEGTWIQDYLTRRGCDASLRLPDNTMDA